METILVIDTGSSSMRGILFDRRGQLLHCEQRKYFMSIEEGGVAEQNAQDFARSLIEICTACASWAAGTALRIEGLSFTSQRSSILPLSADGTPLCPIITWYDKRASVICEEVIRLHGDEIYTIAGMRPTPVLSAPKMTWLRRSRPEIYHAAAKIVGIHDYLLYLCSGTAVTDATLASRTCLMDPRTLNWSGRLLELFGLDQAKLCPLLPPSSLAGVLTGHFAALTGLTAGTPVISGGGDQQCSVLGQGLLRPGEAGVTCGTGAYLAAICSEPLFDPQQRINLNAAVSPGQYVLEASTLSSGSVYDWFNKQFYPDQDQCRSMEQIDKEAADSPAGAGGLLMLPDLAGKGCPDWNDWAQGIFYGLRFSTTRGDCARALLEGIAAEIAECHEVLRQMCPELEGIGSTGGLAKFALFNQILADMIDFPVKRCTIEETTAIGAFMAAAVALGWFNSFDSVWRDLFADSMNGQQFFPQPEIVSLYRRQRQARSLLACSLPDRRLGQILNA